MADQEDRTEAASARQIQRARDEGNVPLSQEVPAFAVLGAIARRFALSPIPVYLLAGLSVGNEDWGDFVVKESSCAVVRNRTVFQTTAL